MRSARSHKSMLIYAERENLKNKPALFIYPFYADTLFILDLDDLTEDTFALLCDKENKLVYLWRGSMFEINDEE